MKNRTILFAFSIVAILVLAAVAYIIFVPGYRHATMKGELSSIFVQSPFIVTDGANLSRVEVWVVPTGTEVSEAIFSHVGDATLFSSGDDGSQVWHFSIPSGPILATSLFVKGYDLQGGVVGSLSLPYVGASDLYNALWGEESGPNEIILSDLGKTFVYSVGSRFSVALDKVQYPVEALMCAPEGIIGRVSNMPDTNRAVIYAVSFETLKAGECTLSDGDFSVTIKVK